MLLYLEAGQKMWKTAKIQEKEVRDKPTSSMFFYRKTRTFFVYFIHTFSFFCVYLYHRNIEEIKTFEKFITAATESAANFLTVFMPP